MVIKLEGSLGDFMNDQDVIAGQDANVIKGNENSITSNSNNTTNNISIYTNPTINKGLSTSDVMSICDFMVNKALAEFNSANEKAITRNEDFAQVFIPRLEKIENYISHISDPKFQFLCRDAMTSAAQTERKEDYQLQHFSFSVSHTLEHHHHHSKINHPRYHQGLFEGVHQRSLSESDKRLQMEVRCSYSPKFQVKHIASRHAIPSVRNSAWYRIKKNAQNSYWTPSRQESRHHIPHEECSTLNPGQNQVSPAP